MAGAGAGGRMSRVGGSRAWLSSWEDSWLCLPWDNGEVGKFPLYLRWPVTAWSAMTKMVSGARVTLTNRKTPFTWP